MVIFCGSRKLLLLLLLLLLLPLLSSVKAVSSHSYIPIEVLQQQSVYPSDFDVDLQESTPTVIMVWIALRS